MKLTSWSRSLGVSMSALAFSACTSMTSIAPPAKVQNGALVGPTGMSLYTFDRDAAGSGKSVCYGGCASNWPPLLAAETDQPTGDYTLITRDNGQRQWALRGKPLYYWSRDSKPGEQSGDGFNNVWHLARPE